MNSRIVWLSRFYFILLAMVPFAAGWIAEAPLETAWVALFGGNLLVVSISFIRESATGGRWTCSGLKHELGDEILKLLNQTYAADSMIERQVGRYHLNFKTDAFGRPVLLFLGKHSRSGKIKGERFTRHIVTDATGKVIKDHWDNKGKT